MFRAFILASLRIHSHLAIGDPESAAHESRTYLEHHLDQSAAYEGHIRTLAAAGEEGEMLAVWNRFHQGFPDKALEQEVVETMCWGVLRKGESACGLTTQLIALLGAALTQDAYAIRALKQGMRHSNSLLRTVAVELAAHYGDMDLKEEITRLFREERVLEVRKGVFAAIGKLKMVEMIPELMKVVGDKKSSPEEKRGAVKAIAQLRERVGREELYELTKSPRAFLRLLACESIAHLGLEEEGDLLIPLIDDSHPEVRRGALQAMGILRLPLHPRVERAAYAKDPAVGVSGAWVLLLSDKAKGEAALSYWLHHDKSGARSLAAAVITASGAYGTDIAQKEIDRCDDAYVRANLALALIGQRVDVEKSSKILDNFLRDHQEKLMWREGLFSPLQKSTLSHNPAIPNFPEVNNQTVRLEILNLLAIVEYPGAQEALKLFLKERRWGVTGVAAETLLGEGDETGIDLVRELLDDPDREIRTEAALVLAIWGRDNTVLPVLIRLYPEADRTLKIKLLEAIGRIGDREAVPFLIERLKEPSQTLRIIAAAVLIQTVNR